MNKDLTIQLIKRYLKNAVEEENKFNGNNDELKNYFEGKKKAYQSVLYIMEG